jgi:hypothetical protein
MTDDVQAVLDVLSAAGLDVLECRATVVRESRFRPVTRYAVLAVDRVSRETLERVVVAKGYYRGGGAATFAAMSHLWRDGFGGDSSLTIPEPIAWSRDQRLLLQGEAPGHVLYEAIDEPEAALDDVRRAGRWLAKLHFSARPKRRPLSEAKAELKVRTHARVVAQLIPDWQAEIGRLADWTIERTRSLPLTSFVPTHGDYQPKNIHLGDEVVTVIDLDRFALAHPARDLGHFLAQSATMSYVRTGSFDRIAGWNEAFTEEYARTGPRWAFESLGAFFVRTMLEILYYKLYVRPVLDPSFVPAWIDECTRQVDEKVSVA